jgi:hypothetical protein
MGIEPIYSVLFYSAILAAIYFAFRRKWRPGGIALAISIATLLAPAGEFVESHDIEVAAPRAKAWSAIKETTANEIFLFQTLTALRRFGRPGPESILNAPEHRPLLEVATSTTFQQLSETPGFEIVIGTYVVQPKRVFATMNFRLDEIAPDRFRVSTKTYVTANDPAARRSFAAYWRVIYPGSSLIRYSWLRAIRARATS